MMTQHRVWRFGDDITTDALAPGAFMKQGIDVIAQHCLAQECPEFPKQVQVGDVIVAGANFGVGSSREQAPAALRHLGIHAVIAPSFSGLFFRNAFNLGLLLLTCPQSHLIQHETQINIDLVNFMIQTDLGQNLACDPIPSFLMDMVMAGGLIPILKQRRQGATHGLT